MTHTSSIQVWKDVSRLTSFKRFIVVNSTVRALMVMSDLRKNNKKIELIDNLLVPTLGSQEGAFENVKPNYAGEQV